MSHYFVNNAPTVNGNHEVHHVGCVRMPVDKRYLGNFQDIREALMEARKDFWQSSGCDHCAREHVLTDAETVRVQQLKLPLASKLAF
jgi:hypothetical protein